MDFDRRGILPILIAILLVAIVAYLMVPTLSGTEDAPVTEIDRQTREEIVISPDISDDPAMTAKPAPAVPDN